MTDKGTSLSSTKSESTSLKKHLSVLSNCKKCESMNLIELGLELTVLESKNSKFKQILVKQETMEKLWLLLSARLKSEILILELMLKKRIPVLETMEF